MVRNMANILLAAADTDKPTTLGKNWVGNNIKRKLTVQTRVSRRYNYSRAEQEHPRVLNDWFQLVRADLRAPVSCLMISIISMEQGSQWA